MPTPEQEMEALLGTFEATRPTQEEKRSILQMTPLRLSNASKHTSRTPYSGTTSIAAFLALAACALLGVLYFNLPTTDSGKTPAERANPSTMAQNTEGSTDQESGKPANTSTYELKEKQTFQISNVNGDISISSWEKTSAEISWKKTGDKDFFDDVEIQIDTDKDGALSVQTRYKKNPARKKSVRVDFEIKLPSTTPTMASVVNGNINIKDIHADVSATSTNGNLDLKDIEGVACTNAVNGQTSLKTITGSVTASSVNGAINVKNCDNKLLLDNVTGAISVELSSASANEICITSVNGKISIDFPKDANAVIDAGTVSGSIDSNLGIEVKKGLVGQHAGGSIGNGGKTVAIETVSGNIQLLAKK